MRYPADLSTNGLLVLKFPDLPDSTSSCTGATVGQRLFKAEPYVALASWTLQGSYSGPQDVGGGDVLIPKCTPHRCDPNFTCAVPLEAQCPWGPQAIIQRPPLIFIEGEVSCFLPFPSSSSSSLPPTRLKSPYVAQAVLKLGMVRLQFLAQIGCVFIYLK